jgi:hypothetical protein
MGVHGNVHIPKESWPYWTWFAIEFFIVMAVAALSSREVVRMFEQTFDPAMQNWVFFGIIGAIYLAWYIGIRPLVFKRKILETRY